MSYKRSLFATNAISNSKLLLLYIQLVSVPCPHYYLKGTKEKEI